MIDYYCPNRCGFYSKEFKIHTYDKKTWVVPKQWEDHLKECYKLTTFEEVTNLVKSQMKG